VNYYNTNTANITSLACMMETPLRRRRFDEILAVLDACFSALLPRNPQRCLVRYNAAKRRLTVIKHGAHYRWKPRRTRGTWNITEPPLIPSLILRIASLTEIDFQSLLHVFFHPWIAANSPFDLPTHFSVWAKRHILHTIKKCRTRLHCATTSLQLSRSSRALDCHIPQDTRDSHTGRWPRTASSNIERLCRQPAASTRLWTILRPFATYPRRECSSPAIADVIARLFSIAFTPSPWPPSSLPTSGNASSSPHP
jgi:hypothetical protein